MTQENLAIVLNRANCCIAEKALQLSKLWSIGSKCYKEELRNLKILNDSVDALLNEAFTQSAKFQIILTSDEFLFLNNTILNTTIYIYINNILHSIEPDNTSTISQLLESKLVELGFTYDIQGPINEQYTIIITTDCSVTDIQLSANILIQEPGNETIQIFFSDMADPGVYELYTGSTLLSSINQEAETDLFSLIETLLNITNLSFTVILIEGIYTITVTTNCSINTLSVVSVETKEVWDFGIKLFPICEETEIRKTYSNIQSGVCQGCLTEEQINTLTERVMSICSICNCELDNL